VIIPAMLQMYFWKVSSLARRLCGDILLCLLCATALQDAVAAPEPDLPRAPEFPEGLDWLNVAHPLALSDLRGKVVILDFWTYGCINCLHVEEELRELEETFGSLLVVIGVHSPKFDNERNLETLRRMVIRLDRRHPVVNDPDRLMMLIYGARAWPTLVVIDPLGGVAGKVAGEGHIPLLTQEIRQLLEENEEVIDPKPLPLDLERERLADKVLAAPGKVAASEHRVAISDTLHNRIVIARPDGKIQWTVGDGQAGLVDGGFGEARFSSPQGVFLSGDRLFVADTGNHAVRLVNLATRQVSTLAGTGRIGHEAARHTDARKAKLRSPWDLVLDGEHLYIAMAGTHQIWRLNLATGAIGPWAGNGREGIKDGDLMRATFSQPSGLALAGRRLYVADAEASAIRAIDLDRGRVSTLVGEGLFEFGDRDSSLKQSLLQHASGIAAIGDSELLVADTYNHKLKRLDLDAGHVTTLAGDGVAGQGSGRARTSRMNEPGGLAVTGDRIYVADTNNDRILLYDRDLKTLSEWHLKP
jgi:thiol-disulfide isomerase/thioredoxin/DNA-binding beta-propeller fold protein YncE